MKRIILNHFFIAVFVVLAAFTSCENNDVTKLQEFTVIFESNGGSSVEIKTVKEGEKISKPTPDPTKIGNTFAEWFKEEALTTEWKFDTDVVTSDMKLYAKWIEDSNENLQYVKTELGGCNISESALKSDGSETEEGNDNKIVITVLEESVHVFIGLNYTCMPPFETKVETIDDVMCMYIIAFPCNDEDCEEADCMCYYTFDFIFKREETTILNQEYKILLIGPRKGQEPVVISEGTIVGNE